MKPISRRFLRVLNSDQAQLISLMDVQLVGQDPSAVMYFTNAGQAITWNGQLYQPLNFMRGSMEERVATTAGEVPQMTLTVTNVDRQMASLLAMAELENAQVTLRIVDRRLLDNPRDALVIAQGEARDIGLADEILTFAIVNVLGQMERITIPRRIYQAKCNYVFGEPEACGVTVPTLDTFCLAGSSRKFLLMGQDFYDYMQPAAQSAFFTPVTQPNEFWANGYVGFMDGKNGLQFRQIAGVQVQGVESGLPGVIAGGTVSAIRLYVRTPFLNDPEPNAPVRVRRQCRKTKTDCQMYQGNVIHFGGFEDVPPVQFRANVVPHDG